RGDRGLERRRVRPLVLDLLERRQQRLPRDARPEHGYHLHQRRHDRRRGSPPVRRHEAHRQRPPRGRSGRTRRLHGVEGELRRLLREAAAGPDRHLRLGLRRAKRDRTAAQARLVRAGGGAGRDARRRLRRGRRPDRRLRALLLVHRRHRHVPRRRRDRADHWHGGPGGADAGTARRNRRSGGKKRPSRGRTARGASLRRSRLRPLSACVKAKLSTDGGARGNPGPAAYGYVLEAEDGTVLDARGETIGVATNNVAEYSGLVAGLRKAVEVGVDELEVVSDSELIVRQMTGEYKVKNEALRELKEEAEDLADRLPRVSFTSVRREHNELADKLVNEALDAA